ncbi:MAG: autotransporter domain-containing protein [Verrucomicrobiota bacterium]
MTRHKHPLGAGLTALALCLAVPTQSYAIIGSGGISGAPIEQKYIDFGAPFGNSVVNIQYGGGQSTGVLVPSTEIGVLKILTAAHVFDDAGDGQFDGDVMQIFFGSDVGNPTGTTATFEIRANNSNVELNPLWAQSSGAPQFDMAVVHVSLANFFEIQGGAAPVAVPVTSQNTQGLVGTMLGHGNHGQGGPAYANNLDDGVLKGGQNVIDFNGEVPPGLGGLPLAISQNLGTALIIDFDGPAGSANQLGDEDPLPLEASAGEGDSGGPILATVDGQLQVTGVVAATDSPASGIDGDYGELTFYPTVANDANEQFLRDAGVLIDAANLPFAPISFTIVDVEAILSGIAGLGSAVALGNTAEQTTSAHVSGIRQRLDRLRRATSRLDRIGGGEINDSGKLIEIEGPGTQRYETWVSGDVASTEIEESGQFPGGNSTVDQDFETYAATAGVDYLLNEHWLAGLAFSRIGSDADLPGAQIDSSGSAFSVYSAMRRGRLSGALFYSYSDIDLDLSRASTLGLATASPSSQAHMIDLSVNYTLRHEQLVHGPLAGVRFTSSSTDGYQETVNGQTGRGLLNVSGQDNDIWNLEAGYGASYHKEVGWGLIAPYLSASIQHQPGSTRAVSAGFQANTFQTLSLSPGSPSGLALIGSSPTLAVTDQSLDNTFWLIQGGVDLIHQRGWNVNLNGFVVSDQSTGEQYGGGVQVGYQF